MYLSGFRPLALVEQIWRVIDGVLAGKEFTCSLLEKLLQSAPYTITALQKNFKCAPKISYTYHSMVFSVFTDNYNRLQIFQAKLIAMSVAVYEGVYSKNFYIVLK